MINKQQILFIDNECILCSKLALWIIKIDKKNLIKFNALNTDFARSHIAPSLLPNNENKLSTVIFYNGEKHYQQSTAIIKLLRSIGGVWKFAIILYIVPKFLRDSIYQLIAKNRYKLFGRSNVCLLQSMPEIKIIN